jgi:hypothetical protein
VATKLRGKREAHEVRQVASQDKRAEVEELRAALPREKSLEIRLEELKAKRA